MFRTKELNFDARLEKNYNEKKLALFPLTKTMFKL
jgi:hypothetical protein